LCAYAQRCAALHGVDLTGGGCCCSAIPACLAIPSIVVGLFLHRACGELALIIYEVLNTLGEIHAYVLPVQPDQYQRRRGAATPDKSFHVSPFIEMAMRYHFRVLPPKESVKLRILESDTMVRCSRQLFNGRRRAIQHPRSCCARSSPCRYCR